jgi:putative peptide zinc metalloprotease protein
MTRQMVRTLRPLRSAAALALAAMLALGARAPAWAQTTGPDSGQGGDAKNIVMVQNRVDGRLTAGGEIQLNRVPGPTAGPVNMASAYSSCTDCQTLAVAMQIDLISRTATSITPQNAATAVNAGCSRCYTVARALQYVLQVDDPTEVPPDVTRLIQAMDRELTAIQTDRTVDLNQAEARINAVIAQFAGLAQNLIDRRDEQVSAASPAATTPPAATTTLPPTTALPPATTASPTATLAPGSTQPPTSVPTSGTEPSPTPSIGVVQPVSPISTPTTPPTGTTAPPPPSATPVPSSTASKATPTPAATNRSTP